jgi:hypothetical protein
MTFALPVARARAISPASASFSPFTATGIKGAAAGEDESTTESLRVAGTVGLFCALVLKTVAAKPSAPNKVRLIMNDISLKNACDYRRTYSEFQAS